MTRRLSAALAILLLPVATGCGSDPGLDDVDAADLERFDGPGFSILLPEEPDEDQQKVPSAVGRITVRTFVVETSDDDAIIVATTALPKGVTTFSLDDGIAGSAASYSGTVEEKKRVKVAGHPALDARITAVYRGDDITFFTRMIGLKDRVVQLLYGIRGKVTKPDDNYFTIRDSLELS